MPCAISYEQYTSKKQPPARSLTIKKLTNRTPFKLITAVTILFLSLYFPFSALAQEPLPEEESTLLIGKDYFSSLHQAIQKASDSVYIIMYFVIAVPQEPHNPVNILIQDLIQAKNRGVEIKIIVENTKQQENLLAYQTFTNTGIQIHFDGADALTHIKAVVIDKKYIFIGSHNWSTAALENNREISNLIESPFYAQQIINYFNSIPTTPGPLLEFKPICPSIPSGFLLSRQAGPNLIKNQSHLAYNLYLQLLKQSHRENSATITINYKQLAKSLGLKLPKRKRLASRYKKQYYYEKLKKPLKTLSTEYNLISRTPYSNLVIINEIPLSGETDKTPILPAFTLPVQYWDYHLNHTLSLRAKHLYLICLYETQLSVKSPYWFRSQKDMAARYHLSEYTISLGLQELERENIIEIYRSTSPPAQYGDRQANTYRTNPLISPSSLKDSLEELKSKYTPALVSKAQNLSSRFNEPKDLDKIETYIRLIQKYGYQKVQEANNAAITYKKGSGLHDIQTTINILQSERE